MGELQSFKGRLGAEKLEAFERVQARLKGMRVHLPDGKQPSEMFMAYIRSIFAEHGLGDWQVSWDPVSRSLHVVPIVEQNL